MLELCAALCAMALVTSAILQTIAFIERDRDTDDDEVDDPLPRDPPPRRLHDVFVPLACGIATGFDGLTEPCCRRRNHGGRCRTEAEIEHIAAIGGETVVRPLSKPDEVEFGETHG